MLTVLIATRNGARTLPGVLEAYGLAQVPLGGFKLVVIDNGSGDDTLERAKRFCSRLPLTLLVENELGKNAALNRGLSAVEGDLTVLTDDDAYPRPDLLVRLRAAADAHSAYSIFGGAVVPRWEVPPPEWVLRWVPPGPAFALTPPSLADGPTAPSNVFGPNMAVRTKVFELGHRFDTSIGPRGTRYPMGSETEFVRRLARQGHTAWHVSGAVVEHFIRESQLKRSWVQGRAVRFGRGQFRLAQKEAGRAMVSWLGIPRYLVRGMCEQLARRVWAQACLDDERAFMARWQFNYLWGQAVEARAMRSEISTAWAEPGELR